MKLLHCYFQTVFVFCFWILTIFILFCNWYIPTIKMFPHEVTNITCSFQSHKVWNLPFMTQSFLTDINNYIFLMILPDTLGVNMSINGTSYNIMFISLQENNLITNHHKQFVGGPNDHTPLNKECPNLLKISMHCRAYCWVRFMVSAQESIVWVIFFS